MRILLTCLLFVLCSGNILAEDVFIIDRSRDYFPIGGKAARFMPEKERVYTAEEIRNADENLFSYDAREHISLGITKDVYWVKFKILNNTGEKIFLRTGNPVLDTAELFVYVKGDLRMKKSVLAQEGNFSIPYTPHALPFTTDTLECYLRAKADVPLMLILSVIAESRIAEVNFWQTMPDIIFFGAVLVMIFYNLFIGITTFSRIYFIYVWYSVCVLLSVAFVRGYGAVFLGEYKYLLNGNFAVFVSLLPISLAFFAKNFLQLKKRYPLGNRLMDISIILHTVAILVFWAGFVNLNVLLFQIFNPYSNLSVLFIGIYMSFKAKYPPAKIFFVAFAIYLFFSTIMNLLFLGILPFHQPLYYLLSTGSMIELVLFSIALGDKINLYRKEKEAAQMQAIELIKEQNVVLEKKVRERTAELQQANEELNSTLSTVAKQRDDIISSINYALRIQKAIIPSSAEIERHFPESFVFFRPKDIVSGDFYWFADKGNVKILAVADCTGHGVSGAFMTMIGNNMLNQIVHDNGIFSPDEILNLTSPYLLKTLSNSEGKVKDGMDISVVSFYYSDSILQKFAYAGAMNPIFIVDSAGLKEIKADKMPVGVDTKSGFSYTKHEFVLNEDTMLYMFSDGYQDQFGGTENRKFMVKSFRTMLEKESTNPAKKQLDNISRSFDSWKGTNRQTDDVLLIGLRLFCLKI